MNNRDAISAEWELILLAALANVGEVEHEPELGGSARLDIRFRSPKLRFIADIRAVSDEDSRQKNPVGRLAAEFSILNEKLRSEGIRGTLSFRVNGVAPAVWRREWKTRLLLPHTHEFRKLIFGQPFEDFLDAIRREPAKIHYHVVNDDRVSVSTVFNPGGPGTFSYTHPPYNVAHDPIRNVVYHDLERKAKQIKRAGQRDPGELAGVILCDAACELLQSSGGVGTVGIDTIIATFLRGSSTIDFVSVVEVHRPASIWGSTDPLKFQARVWFLRQPTLAAVLEDMLNSAFQMLPPPTSTAINTLNHFNWMAESNQGLYARYKHDTVMRTDSVEISLRAAMDYLAGRIDRAQFESAVPIDWIAYLQRCLDQGQSVSAVSIARYPGEDDDGLVITLSGHDAAAAPFQARGQEEVAKSTDTTND